MLSSFAELNLTSSRKWTCPNVREGGALVIKAGRHPIMAELPETHIDGGHDGVGFIPNDTYIDPTQSLHVVSGVNGSGKTT
jgi:DNA mismatch repair ATPase MutS